MISVQQATQKDIDDIVRIHERAFPDFFLTILGSNFLRIFYKSVLNQNDGILLVCKMDDCTLGLCAGTLKSAGFYSRLIRCNIIQYSIEGVKVFFSNPRNLIHLVKNMSKDNPSVGDDGNYAELLSIAVSPKMQRCGAGKAMLLALEKEVRERDIKRLSLTTDYKDNERAIAFYKSLGYEPWYEFVTYPNRRMYRLIKQIK